MRITYHGPHDGVIIPALHQVVVERGKTIEVDDELGARLVEQSTWDTGPADIVAWVADDPDRARRLLVAERHGAGREDVIAHLEQVAAPQQSDDSGGTAGVPTAVLVEPPAGTVDEVLAWVGDDPTRAARALEVEVPGKNRASLVSQLERLSTKEID